MALAELEKIPIAHRTPHLEVYRLLRKVKVLSEPSITQMSALCLPMVNPDHLTWSQIHTILPDDSDAKHVFQAAQHRVDYFVTVDKLTILKHKKALAARVGIRAVKPSELLASL